MKKVDRNKDPMTNPSAVIIVAIGPRSLTLNRTNNENESYANYLRSESFLLMIFSYFNTVCFPL